MTKKGPLNGPWRRALSALIVVATMAPSLCAQSAKPSLISPFRKEPETPRQNAASPLGDLGRSALSGKEIVALELANAEISEVLKILSDISGRTIVPSENLKGKISFFAKDTNCGELLDALSKANNWTLVQEGRSILVMSQEEYTQQYGPSWKVYGPEHCDASELEKTVQAILSKNGKVASTGKGGLIVIDGPRNLVKIEEAIRELDNLVTSRVFDLPSGNAAFAAETIKAVLSKEASVAADVISGRLVVRDSPKRLDEAAKVLSELNEGVLTEVFALNNASAQDVAQEIERAVSDPTAIRFDSRTNQLILTEREDNLGRLRTLIEKLDRTDGLFTRTFYLEHGDCQQVQQTVLEVLGRSASAPAAQPSDTRSNATETQAPPAEGDKGAEANDSGQGENKQTADSAPLRAAPERVGDRGEKHEASGGGPTIAADPRINALIVTDTTAMLDRIAGLIRELDREEKLHVYRLNYCSPETLKLDEKLSGLLNQPGENFAVDEMSRTVTFNASAGKAKQVLTLLTEWDRQPRQIYLEAKVVAIDRDNTTDIGTEFDALLNQLSSKIIPVTRLMTSFPGETVDSPGSLIQIGSIDGDHYQALLRLIQSRSETQLLSSPKIVALDGNAAQFQVATDEPYTEVTTDPDGNRIVQNVRFIPVGVILNVLPMISDEGFITMDVHLEVSSLKTVRGGVPVVNRSVVQSRVVVKEDHTLIIGGLISDQEVEVRSGVPLLQRIPLLGWLFRSTRKQHIKSELVLLLTPRVVSDGAAGSELSLVPENAEKGLLPQGEKS
jgi:type II secretory pathway component GspD/PulD (secretin)